MKKSQPKLKILLTSLSMLIFMTTVLLTSCSKSDDTPATPAPVTYAEQNPLAGYLTNSGFSQKTTNVVNGGDYEFGFSFKPTVTGKITAIVAKIPDVRLAMRVTFWDKMAGTILRTELMDMTSSGVEIVKVISALDLVKDKEYYITFNSNDWYDRRKTDNSVATYPIVSGDITITGYSFYTGTTQTVPNSPQLGYYAGDCSFKFQRTE